MRPRPVPGTSAALTDAGDERGLGAGDERRRARPRPAPGTRAASALATSAASTSAGDERGLDAGDVRGLSAGDECGRGRASVASTGAAYECGLGSGDERGLGAGDERGRARPRPAPRTSAAPAPGTSAALAPGTRDEHGFDRRRGKMNTIAKIKEKLADLGREKGGKEFDVLLDEELARANAEWTTASAALEISEAADDTHSVTGELVDDGDAGATEEDGQDARV